MNRAFLIGIFIAVCSGCATKTVVERTPGIATLPPQAGLVCILPSDGGILNEIPNTPIGLVKLRKRGDVPGDILDLLANEVRRNGGNLATIGKLNDARGHGYAYFVDPALKFNCQAAGGMVR